MDASSTGIDDGRDAWGRALADVVKVKHALNGIGLIAVDESLGIPVKENVVFPAH